MGATLRSSLQLFIKNQNDNIGELIEDVINHIPKHPRINKFDVIWDKTELELSHGCPKTYEAFVDSRLLSISHIRKYLKHANPYQKNKPKDGDNVSFGFGHGTKFNENLTKALIVFLKNYYGEKKANQMLQCEIWRPTHVNKDIE